MPAPDEVILVDTQDHATGSCQTMEAHRQGLLHRAFSVFIFSSDGRLLLQQRAASKYHSGGLWTNTCCGHPRPGETVHAGATRRLREEMGIRCDLTEVFQFIYHAVLPNDLTENEIDHVLFGMCEDEPRPDAAEVAAWKREDCSLIQQDLLEHPEKYTVWLRLCFDRIVADACGRTA